MERLGCFNTPMWTEWEAEYPTILSQMARAWSVEWSVSLSGFFHIVFSCPWKERGGLFQSRSLQHSVDGVYCTSGISTTFVIIITINNMLLQYE